MDIKKLEADKKKPHVVTGRLPIKYRSGHPDARYVQPGETVPTLDHLDVAGYLALLKARRVRLADGKGDKS